MLSTGKIDSYSVIFEGNLGAISKKNSEDKLIKDLVSFYRILTSYILNLLKLNANK